MRTNAVVCVCVCVCVCVRERERERQRDRDRETERDRERERERKRDFFLKPALMSGFGMLNFFCLFTVIHDRLFLNIFRLNSS